MELQTFTCVLMFFLVFCTQMRFSYLILDVQSIVESVVESAFLQRDFFDFGFYENV
jgi:hypothetical protein